MIGVVKRNDLDVYDRHAAEWWQPESRTFRSLQSSKAYHRARLAAQWGQQLDGANWVDLGGGGGLLSVPFLPRLRQLTIVDLSAASLHAAQLATTPEHRAHLQLLCADVRATGLTAGCADLVTLSDVVEHVPGPEQVLREAARLVRPGGRVFVNTIARTPLATLLAVHLSEGCGLIPRGTHDPRLFVHPRELLRAAAAAGLRLERIDGEMPRLWATIRHRAIHLRRSRALCVAYSAFFVRDPS